MNDAILEFDNVTKEFPGLTALSQVSFSVRRGSIHGICGENGAGKSTLMKILSGVHPHDSYEGRITFDGEELAFTGSSIRQAIEKGIAIVYQEFTLVQQLTVGENVFLGREPLRGGLINWHRLNADTQEILARYNLKIPFHEKVHNLGVGQQQMVEIAKALSENAKLLILDEPTSALTETEVAALFGILRLLKQNGVTCIYISHKLEEFFNIADSLTVIRDGMMVRTMPIAEARTEEVVRMMVGREMTERFPKRTHAPGDVVFSVRNLSTNDPLDPRKRVIEGVSFDLRAGEVLGLAGLVGAGRSELLTTIFGEYGVRTEGEAAMGGKRLPMASARDAMENRISLVPEDRKLQGLMVMDSILHNMSLPNLRQYSSALRINKPRELKACSQYMESLKIKATSIQAVVDSLSGGNQQKVVIAKWLMSRPLVLLLDEPTRGIDVGAKYEIYKLINELAEKGVAIIMASSELPEILGMCDRILVMCKGRAMGILDRAEASQETIMTMAMGLANRNSAEAPDAPENAAGSGRTNGVSL
jgi:D-xylose transport system ATP-binding protein